MKNSLSKTQWWIIIIIVFTLMFGGCIAACIYFAETPPLNQISENNKYETKITWSGLDNYCCAVEIDGYNGDILQAGSYCFYPDLVSGLDKGKIPIVWDVYVSENAYGNIYQLKESEYKGTFGGFSNENGVLELFAGQYVYVKYHPVANNNPTGALIIEKMS